MAALKFKISYPQPEATIPANDFVVYGTVPMKKGKIKAVLIDRHFKVKKGKILLGPPKSTGWYAHFTDVQAGSYVAVVIYERAIAEHRAVPFTVTVKKNLLSGPGNIPMPFSPQAGGSIGDPLCVQGYSTGVADIECNAQLESGGDPIPGTPLLETEGGAYCVSFDIPDGLYDFTVYDGGDSGTTPYIVTAVTVQANNGLPVELAKKKKKKK